MTGPASRAHEGPARSDVHAVVIEHLSEHFRIALERPPTLKDRLATLRRARYEPFTALKDVDLKIRHGESVAFIGHNGSGKSTLLKCIAGILPADEGSVTVNGRIATLLELGAGFAPELSGRENVYLNGSILGLSRAEVSERFDAIVDFAGVRDFIDTPVRNYSSGMYVRLGFAIAVHVDPEILLVDEVLAVGDADFQERSLARMRSFGQRGKTVVLVSHDLETVQQICERGVVLDHGRVVFDGPTDEAAEYYLDLVHGERTLPEEPEEDEEPETPLRTGDRRFRIRRAALYIDGVDVGAPRISTTDVGRGGRDEDAERAAAGGAEVAGDRAAGTGAVEGQEDDGTPSAPVPSLRSGTEAQVQLVIESGADVSDASLSVGVAVRRPDMQLYVYETRTAWRGIYLPPPAPGAALTVTFTLDLAVLTGSYVVDLLVADARTGGLHDRWQGALVFGVDAPVHEFGVADLHGRIGIWNPDGVYPDDIHAPPPERGGPRRHALREGSPSRGYEVGVLRLDTEGRPAGEAAPDGRPVGEAVPEDRPVGEAAPDDQPVGEAVPASHDEAPAGSAA